VAKSQNQTISLFPPHLQAIAEALQEIFVGEGYADKVIERTLRADKRRGAHDRAFIAENIYEIVRWYRLLHSIRGKEPQAVADWWEIIGIRYLIDGHELPKWREFAGLNPEHIRKRYQELRQQPAIAASIPDWLETLGQAELGERWRPTMQMLNVQAKVVLRTNRLKTTPEALQKQLAGEGVRTDLQGPDALVLRQRRNVFRTDAFKQGLFEVQDYSSQQVAPFLEVEAGMRVVDACAGAGGKSLHLAALMDNKGQLLSLDTAEWKLHNLKQRARRNGVHVIETRTIENTKVIKRLYGSADRLLLDVPCSGLGVIRRNPDSKWKLTPAFIEEIKGVQQDILQRYSRILKPTGKLVYATCSILPSENQQQVATFLASEAGKGFQLEEERIILPQDEGFDGFYMARLSKP
jgi:16S rRNA (cytosine967-C5)-methyltransferase